MTHGFKYDTKRIERMLEHDVPEQLLRELLDEADKVHARLKAIICQYEVDAELEDDLMDMFYELASQPAHPAWAIIRNRDRAKRMAGS